MATQISSDIATEINVTARKSDSFYLKITLTKADGSAYDFSAYETAQLNIINANKDTVRTFKSDLTTVALPNVSGAISLTDAATGILVISVAGGNMIVPKGNYTYKLYIENTDPVVDEKITVMYGKFKIND